jgi:hypothetical protein
MEATTTAMGGDDLSRYLEQAHRNLYATFVKDRSSYQAVAQIDGVFLRMIDAARQARPVYPNFFVQTSHCSFRTGLGLLMAGQMVETYPVLRFCLEAAYYGFYIGDDNARMERWLRRDETEESEK